jgi:hypothetical protein
MAILFAEPSLHYRQTTPLSKLNEEIQKDRQEEKEAKQPLFFWLLTENGTVF